MEKYSTSILNETVKTKTSLLDTVLSINSVTMTKTQENQPMKTHTHFMARKFILQVTMAAFIMTDVRT